MNIEALCRDFFCLAIIVSALFCLQPAEASVKDNGYRGIWFTLGEHTEYGDKYSGGLGTYTTSHVPIAIYSPKVNKTFFVYGGSAKDDKHLLAMASYYDHSLGVVPYPTIVHDKQGVDDPHDNPSINLDSDGHVWVFVSGRGKSRPGFKYRSTQPYSVDNFELVSTEEFTYPQPWFIPGNGFIHLFTKYTNGRELYWETSPDGKTWSEDKMLAGFGGHYQTSDQRGTRVITAFNWHPDGKVNKRTNLYLLMTEDLGKTWRNAAGKTVEVPLDAVANDALVRDYEKEGLLVYISDTAFDKAGNPVILYVLSRDYRPGPLSNPRVWSIAHWTGSEWEFSEVTSAYHNYDVGSVYIERDGAWRIIAPTEPGPFPYGTGGEMAVWISHDEGKTWDKTVDATRNSSLNHSYARRPVDAHPDFYAFWADGNPKEFSESRLYFADKSGKNVRVLPAVMTKEFEVPEIVKQR